MLKTYYSKCSLILLSLAKLHLPRVKKKGNKNKIFLKNNKNNVYFFIRILFTDNKNIEILRKCY